MPDAADTHSHRSKPGSLCDPGSDAGVGRSPDPPARTHRKRGSAAFLRAVPRRRSVLHRGSGGARVLPCAHAQQKLAKKEARKRPDLRGLGKSLGRRAWRKARRLLLFSLSHICAKLTTPSRKFFRPPLHKKRGAGKMPYSRPSRTKETLARGCAIAAQDAQRQYRPTRMHGPQEEVWRCKSNIVDSYSNTDSLSFLFQETVF